MIRPITLFCAFIAALSGLYLYQVKHQTQLLERNIARTNQAIAAAQERSGVLRAEWTLMNDPERLADLAGQHLKLGTVTPRQFTTLADLSARLPAVRAVPARPDGGTDLPADTNAEPEAEPVAESPLPLPPPLPPRLAVAPAPGSAPAQPQAAATSATTPAPAGPRPAPISVAAPATPRPQVPPARPAQAAASPPPVAPTPVAASGSALGMARGIVAPPVPMNGNLQLTGGN